MNWLKTKFIGAMTGVIGIFLTPLIARLLLAVVAQIEKIDPELAAQIPQAEIQTWVMGFIASLIAYFVIKPVKSGVEVMQEEQNAAMPEAAPIPVDGLPFAKTQTRQRTIRYRAGGNPAKR